MKRTGRSSRSNKASSASQVRAYLTSVPAGARRALQQLRAAIRAAAPRATEAISYGIPAFRLDGERLVYCAGWRAHTSLYPLTAGMRRACGRELERYEMSKGTVRFPLTE